MSINKLSNASGLSSHSLTTTSRTSTMSRIGLKLTLTAVSICGLGVSSSAQSSAAPEVAAEKGFTIPLNAQTPMVLQTQPDAACNLHADGVTDAAHTMRLYANADGYVVVHMGTKYQAQQEVRLQLDCTAADKVTTYPLHLRAGSAPTDDMPTPQTSVPTPKGSRILPALTDAAAKQLSDQDLRSQGYPRRPDAVASPDSYKAWLDLVSRPMTQLPPHSVSRSDISHHPSNAEAGTKGSSNWSGYEAQAAKGSYNSVQGEWNVPTIVFGENGYQTWSSFWVGLDGDGTTDLIQAGTNQNYLEVGSFTAASYYAWTELVPNQATEQEVTGFTVNPGDDIFVQVMAPAGDEPCDFLWNKTQAKSVAVCTPLGSTQFGGSEAEWIMERPCLGQCNSSTPQLSELSAYVLGVMTNAYVWPTKSAPIPAGTAATVQINMYNSYLGHSDDNLLSIGLPGGPEAILFQWINFH
jgi:hypothetical protein